MEVEQISGNGYAQQRDNVIHVRREYDESKIAQGAQRENICSQKPILL